MNTNLADCIHLPVTDPSLAEVISDIKQCLIHLTLCFWAPAMCDADFPGDTSSDNPHLLFPEFF